MRGTSRGRHNSASHSVMASACESIRIGAAEYRFTTTSVDQYGGGVKSLVPPAV
jgi:hypothetical protein